MWVPHRTPATAHRYERKGGGEELWRELIRIAADRSQESDDPLGVSNIAVPHALHFVHEVAPGRTRVRWVLAFQRRLDPGWYFAPLERFGAREAAGSLIDGLSER